MKFKKGKDRLVSIFPALGIAIKFPIIRFLAVIRASCRQIRNGDWKLLRKSWSFSVKSQRGLKGVLLRGLLANWREYRFYQRTKNPFLQPTYFSFYGLVNVQQVGEPCLIRDQDLWRQLLDLTMNEVWADAHHFSNPENFCFYKGKLRMHDYGSSACQTVIERYGEKIFYEFDPAYRGEVDKLMG